MVEHPPALTASRSELLIERRRWHYAMVEHACTGMSGEREPGSEGRDRSGEEARIAVIGTPRSGNSWMRFVLGSLLGAEEFAVYHPADLDWSRLPSRAVMQLHWPRTPHLEKMLDEAGVRVVTIARHPFDILVSILRYAQIDPDTTEWLWGEGGDEDSIVDADPASEAFAAWALSDRAARLLEVTDSWLSGGGAVGMRYEDTIADPEREVRRALDELGLTPIESESVAAAVGKVTPGWVNDSSSKTHAWLATCDTWKQVLPVSLVDALAERYGGLLRRLGYLIEREGAPDSVAALERWNELFPNPPGSFARIGIHGELTILDAPDRASTSSLITVLTKVRNGSSITWPAGNRHPKVLVSCRWHRAGEEEAFAEEHHRRNVGLMPGHSCYQPMSFTAPSEPGRYRLAIDLVHESVNWLGVGVAIDLEVE